MRLETRLKQIGYPGHPEEFAEVVLDQFHQLFVADTVDALLCCPSKGLRLCEAVRARLQFPVPEEIVLSTLLNARKAARTS